MDTIETIEELEAMFDAPVPASLTKVAKKMTPMYQKWIEASRFVILSTVGPEGTDASPRGDDGPVVRIHDDTTVLLPDWRGNNRIDSLRNIVRDPRTSLMFMVPGSKNVVRINGNAVLTTDTDIIQSFEKNGMVPKVVIAMTVQEMYFQCAKAIMRSNLWSAEDESGSVPTAGQFVKEMQASFDAETYDAEYEKTAKDRFWA